MLVKYITSPAPAFSLKFLIVFGISLSLLILASKIQIPMIPVPITLQTAVIMLIATLCGLRMSLSVLGSYFALGLLGVPVFAMAAGAVPGPAYFIGPTGGYLAGFMIITMALGFFCQKIRAQNFLSLSLIFLLAHLLILFFGWGWLAYGLTDLGANKAYLGGVAPFYAGSFLKSFLVAAIIKSVK